MFNIVIKQTGVACLCLVLSAVDASRTPPAGVQAKALISKTSLTVSDKPNEHRPLWENKDTKKIPVPKMDKSDGTKTGIEPIDDVSKEVPKDWEHLHTVAKTLKKISDDPEKVTEHKFPKITGTIIMQSLVSIFMSMICLLICAFGYTRVKKDAVYPPQDGTDHSVQALSTGKWRYGMFDCMHDSHICLISCCCPCIRWSDTMRMAGLMAFWTAIFVMGFLGAASSLTGGLALLVMLCLATYRRQQVRKLFGMNSGDATSYCEDCCLYIFCSCCAIAQEARQLEEAYAVGYPLQIKEPLRPQSQRREEPLMSATRMQPPPSQRIDYQPQSQPQRVEYQSQSQLQRSPQPSWGQVQQPQWQPQPQMAQPQPMTSLPPARPQQMMASLPPAQFGSQPLLSQQVIMPPQSMQSMPLQGAPVQYQQQPFMSAPMGAPMTSLPPAGSPMGSMQSLGPTQYRPQ